MHKNQSFLQRKTENHDVPPNCFSSLGACNFISVSISVATYRELDDITDFIYVTFFCGLQNKIHCSKIKPNFESTVYPQIKCSTNRKAF